MTSINVYLVCKGKAHNIKIQTNWRPVDVYLRYKTLISTHANIQCAKCKIRNPNLSLGVSGRITWPENQTAEKFGIKEGSIICIVERVFEGGMTGAIQYMGGVRFTSNNYNRTIDIPSFHVSCRSDKIDGKSDMVGIVLYQYNGRTDWRLNGIHCRTGYIYIKKSANLRNISTSMGTWHSKCYKSLFGVDHKNVVGAGFALKSGKWRYNSFTFNAPGKSDGWHNDTKAMHVLEERWIKRAMDAWKQGKQTVKVSDFGCIDGLHSYF